MSGTIGPVYRPFQVKRESPAEERRMRLAEQLRENLNKRKQQQRRRAAESGGADEAEIGSDHGRLADFET